MMKRLAELAREHILMAFLISLVPSGVAIGVAIYEARINRTEDLKVSQFKDLSSEQNHFLESLSAFTENFARSGTPDPSKRKELSMAMVRYYDTMGSFASNLPHDQVIQVRQLQSSLNAMRNRVQTADKKTDLDGLSVAFVQVYRDMKTLQPIMKEAVGMPADPST
jgi:hypothetical protein